MLEYQPAADTSWYWKKICEMKQSLSSVYDMRMIGQDPYKISKTYALMKPTRERDRWSNFVREIWAIPKHQFISWLAVQGRLATRDRLLKFGANTKTECLLCGDHAEIHEHMFFQCSYNKRFLQDVASVLTGKEFCQTLRAARRRDKAGKTRFQKGIIRMGLLVMIYWIWKARNTTLWDLKISCILVIVNTIKFAIRTRLLGLSSKYLKISNRDFIEKLV
ncbi:uncharacterized protein LOC110722186 [Chenopodium quinoa]|uniref:uncharacterized protein LOC110722186 n=1 Tax=Chenopodium quinoa TaxID=63459 RepID=UPI000B771F3F|nr:uncharacterized protein LOC110722186 [Chenopodium quinoa]